MWCSFCQNTLICELPFKNVFKQQTFVVNSIKQLLISINIVLSACVYYYNILDCLKGEYVTSSRRLHQRMAAKEYQNRVISIDG